MATKTSLHRKLPVKVKLGYGFGGFSTIFTLTLTVLYTNPFLVDTVGLAPAFVGLMVAIATIWDAISDPLIGHWSDKRDPAKGRRRPFFLWVSIPYAVAIWLYFTNWGFGELGTQIYFVFVFLLYYTVHTVFDVPYTALAGEMTLDYDERTSVNTYRRWASDIAGILAGLFFYAVGYFAASTQDVFKGYSYSAGIFGVLCAITILVAYKTTKGYEPNIDLPKNDFSFKYFVDPLKNKSFLYVILHFSTALIGQAFINAWVIFYFGLNVGLNVLQITFLIVFSFSASALVWTGLCGFLARKISKKGSYLLLLSLFLIVQIIMPLFVLENGSVNLAYIYGILYGAFNAPLWMLTWSMIPDCIEIDEFKTGHRREGLYFGVLSFVQKASVAIAIAVSGIVLQQIGYAAGATEQAPTVLDNLKNAYAFLPAVFILISIVIVSLNPMTRERHTELLKILRKKKAGEAYDITPIKELL